MEYILSYGMNLYDFFVFPTVRIHVASRIDNYITVEWLKWYVGIKWFDGSVFI